MGIGRAIPLSGKGLARTRATVHREEHLIAARLGSGSSNVAVGFELEVIATVVLGGTYLFGGRGTIIGTLLGALTTAVIDNSMILLKILLFFTQIVTGAIILAAIWLNTRLFRTAQQTRR